MKLDKHFKDIWNPARQRFCPVVSCSVSKLLFSVLGLLSCSFAVCSVPVSDTFFFERSIGLFFLINLPFPLDKVTVVLIHYGFCLAVGCHKNLYIGITVCFQCVGNFVQFISDFPFGLLYLYF